MFEKAPDKLHRKGISLFEIMRKFPDDATAEAWFAEKRWSDGVCYPHCGADNVKTECKHPSQPYRCREKRCRKCFGVKTGTVMQGSNLGCQAWAIAIYLTLTSVESVCSMKLNRDLNVTQKSAPPGQRSDQRTRKGCCTAGPVHRTPERGWRQDHLERSACE